MQPLEGDFGVLIAPGLELAFGEREPIQMEGHTLKGEQVSRTIPVCGPGALIVLKALALADRGEPKDAYDIVYVLRRWPHGITDIADRLARHAAENREVVDRALKSLASDFAEPDSLGPRRAAQFESTGNIDPAATADAHGYVDDLLRACRERGLPAK